MKTIVFGGTGFIGTHLVRFLLKEGHTVTIVTRSPSRAAQQSPFDPNQLSFAELKEDMASLLDGKEVVINLAGESLFGKRWTKNVKERLYNSRINTTRSIIDGITKVDQKPKLLISSSAVGYYGDTENRKVTERQGSGEGFLSDICVDWEKEAYKAEESGVRVVIPRTGIVLGRDGGALSAMSLAYRYYLGGTIGPGTQYLPWIHVDDMCQSIIHVINKKNFKGPYNCCAPEPVTMAVFSKELAGAMNRPSFFYIPVWLLRTVLGEASVMLTQSTRAFPEAIEASGFTFGHVNLRSAIETLVKKRSGSRD